MINSIQINNFMENNGKWHHKVPNKNELDKINKILN